ncbi:RnfABCDGE type electron transport complex subunit D [Clostridium hydrogeniformans]|uniref:RnfABCDGE type electron transport complex subunit D n=1 Tax=Clostridium hydrogeniformans TaxID=349933 RepID=UPI00068B964F|nr:RnfABCDGE type electron transport complex subunit D [Clostridium hydrogeniformans]
MEKLMRVSFKPFIRSKKDKDSIIRDVFIALLPAAGAGIYFYKKEAAYILLVSLLSSVFFEALWQKIFKRKITIKDFSALVTGLLIGLILPPHVPLWLPVVANGFAIIIVKQFFGGLGQNIMNPALAAKVFLITSYSSVLIKVSEATEAVTAASGAEAATEAVTSASGAGAEVATNTLPSLWDIFVGQEIGTIGEVSILALFVGFIYLSYRGVIKIHTTVIYLVTCFLFYYFFGKEAMDFESSLRGIMSGSIMIAAIFGANDYATTPMSFVGQVIFAIVAGILTGLFRIYGYNSEGAYYAIIIMNLFTPLIDKMVFSKLRRAIV